MGFWYRIQKLMSGRYGTDFTFFVIIAVAMFLAVLNVFLNSLILQLIIYTFIICALLRAMSRNFLARKNENKWVVDFVSKYKKKIEVIRQRKADVTHIYKKCPNCKVVLRLPKRQGKHTTVCPKCNFSFKVNVK